MSEAVDAAVYTVRAPVTTVLPTSTLAVSPDAAVYAVVPRRRPRAGEPRHAFPDRLPCAGEVTAVGQACRATVARCCTGQPS
jgi:hypothetical protein